MIVAVAVTFGIVTFTLAFAVIVGMGMVVVIVGGVLRTANNENGCKEERK